MDDEWKDWVEKVDKNSGESYWYNTKTGATEWTTFKDEDGDGLGGATQVSGSGLGDIHRGCFGSSYESAFAVQGGLRCAAH